MCSQRVELNCTQRLCCEHVRTAHVVSHAMLLQSPGRWYSYRVHGGRIMRFQAPPPPGRKEGFRFLVYGDMGDPDHRKAKAPGWVLTCRAFSRQCAQAA